MLPDITSEKLHSQQATEMIGFGDEYLSDADSVNLEWPAVGVIFGYNRRLMIKLSCRRARPDKGYKVLNTFFLLDTGSPVSFLSSEAMDALIARPGCPCPKMLKVVVQNESKPVNFHLSPPNGRFHDVNVLGMDWMERNELSLVVDFPISCFQLVKKDMKRIMAEYPEYNFETV